MPRLGAYSKFVLVYETAWWRGDGLSGVKFEDGDEKRLDLREGSREYGSALTPRAASVPVKKQPPLRGDPRLNAA